jgi:hypothetical protein
MLSSAHSSHSGGSNSPTGGSNNATQVKANLIKLYQFVYQLKNTFNAQFIEKNTNSNPDLSSKKKTGKHNAKI